MPLRAYLILRRERSERLEGRTAAMQADMRYFKDTLY